MSAKRVLVVGDVMLDVVVRPTAPTAPTSDTPAEIRVVRGGSSATLAVTLVQHGHQVTFVGASGDDAASDLFASTLVAAGVTPRLQIATATTGVVVAMVDHDAQRAMFTDRGANRELARAFVLDGLSDFDHVHVSGYLVLDDATRDVARAVLAEAATRGLSTSLDVCSVAPLRQLTPERFLEASVDARWLFANAEEALVLAGESDLDVAVRVLSRHYDEVFVTRGSLGAWLHADGRRHSVAAHAVVARDTTGAGDASAGAYLGSRLGGGSIVAALQAAMDAGARAIRELGAPN